MISETVKRTQVICCPPNADPSNVGKAIDLDLIVEREALVDDLVSTDIQVLATAIGEQTNTRGPLSGMKRTATRC
ncbi:MAG: hypothetical protein ACRD1T_20655 [Acidimicrobiia bacterium]